MKEKILIFGIGQIGSFYKNFFDSKGIDSELTKTDVTNQDSVNETINQYGPEIVINTAGKTNLEWCEKNKLETFNVNVLGADNVAKACDKSGIYLIHFSSGCIFETKSEKDAKKETDTPTPAAYYALSKVWAEHVVPFKKSKSFKYIILRPRQPISSKFNYKNTLVKLVTFTQFVDTQNTVTILEDLMEWTLQIIKKQPFGVLHVANPGWTTPYQEALLLKKHILPNLPIERISKEELDRITPERRVDTVLDVTKLRQLGVDALSVEQRLEEVIINLGKDIRSMTKEEIRTQLEKTLAQSNTRAVTNSACFDLIEMGK